MQKKFFPASELLHCLGILGGTLLYSLGMNLFVVPAGLYTGGIMGLSQLLRTFLLRATGWTPAIDIAGLINYAINLPMLLLAWRRLDHRVVLKTLLSVTGTTIFLSLVPRTDILSGDQLARCLIGGMLCGCSRTAAAEFTFFLAIPVMFGWGVLKLIKYLMAVGLAMTATEIAVLVVGIVTAFVVSVISIKFLMGYIKKNDFTAFGVYRIIVGLVVLAYFGVKVLL